jgi:hypothetical protein
MSAAGTKEGLLIQALKNLRKEHVDRIARARIRKFLKDSNEEEIKKNMRFAPAWIRPLFLRLWS